MKTLYVRIKPKTGAIGFFRCGMKFTPAWQKVEGIDDATAQRLEQEQMLEVSEDQPDDYVDETAAADGEAAQTAASETQPNDYVVPVGERAAGDGGAAQAAASERSAANPKKGGK